MLFLKHMILWGTLLLMGPHPFFLSVTDMKYNEKNKSMEIACKMFTTDLEDALKRTTKKHVDLINAKDKKENENMIFEYIKKRLNVSINGKTKNLTCIGYEKEDDVIWTYMEIEKCEKPKHLIIQNSLLYDFLKEQINLVSYEIDGNKRSSKVSNPDKEIKF